MQIIFSVHISDEFVVKNPHDHIVRTRKGSGPSKQFGSVNAVTFNRPATHERQRNLRTETSCKPKPVFQFGIIATCGKVEVAQFWVLFLVVGDGRDAARLQTVEHACIFDSDGHRVARESFGVRNHEAVGGIAKSISQRFHFRLSRTPACWSVGLMRKEDRLRCNVVSIDAPALLHASHESVDDASNVFNIKACAMVCRIRCG